MFLQTSCGFCFICWDCCEVLTKRSFFVDSGLKCVFVLWDVWNETCWSSSSSSSSSLCLFVSPPPSSSSSSPLVCVSSASLCICPRGVQGPRLFQPAAASLCCVCVRHSPVVLIYLLISAGSSLALWLRPQVQSVFSCRTCRRRGVCQPAFCFTKHSLASAWGVQEQAVCCTNTGEINTWWRWRWWTWWWI